MTTVAAVNDFTDVEASTLVQCERVIERGLKTFVEVGTALATIRDGRLYRTEYDSFEDYCDQRWAISRPRAYELMSAAQVVSAIADTGMRPPANEAQARELSKLRDRPDKLRDAWAEASERANGRPTAATVREVVQERQSPPLPKGQDIADTIVASIDQQTAAGVMPPPAAEPPAAPSPPSAGGSTPDRPPKWDPAEREAHEAEVLRIKDIEAAHRFAKTLVADVRTLVLTVLAGYRLGEHGLVTRQDIADIRRTLDLLEKELDDEE